MRMGILEPIKKSTTTIVPVIIISAFQLMAVNTEPKGRMPDITNSAAEASAICGLYLGNATMRTYVAMNRMIAIIFIGRILYG